MGTNNPIEAKLKGEYTSFPTGVKGLNQLAAALQAIKNDSTLTENLGSQKVAILNELQSLSEKIFTNDRTYFSSLEIPNEVTAFVKPNDVKSSAEKFKNIQEIKKDNLQKLANDFAEVYAQGKPQNVIFAAEFYAWCVLSCCFVQTVVSKMAKLDCLNLSKKLDQKKDNLCKVVRRINKSIGSYLNGRWVPLNIAQLLDKKTLAFPSIAYLKNKHRQLLDINGFTGEGLEFTITGGLKSEKEMSNSANAVNGNQQMNQQQTQLYQNPNQNNYNYNNYNQNTVSYNNNNQNQVPQQQFQNQNAYAQQAPQSPSATGSPGALDNNQKMVLDKVVTSCLDTYGESRSKDILPWYDNPDTCSFDVKKDLIRFLGALSSKGKARLFSVIQYYCQQCGIQGQENDLYNALRGYLNAMSKGALKQLFSRELEAKIEALRQRRNIGDMSSYDIDLSIESNSNLQTLIIGIDTTSLVSNLIALYKQTLNSFSTKTNIRQRAQSGDVNWFRESFVATILAMDDEDMEKLYKLVKGQYSLNGNQTGLIRQWVAVYAQNKLSDQWYIKYTGKFLDKQERDHFKRGVKNVVDKDFLEQKDGQNASPNAGQNAGTAVNQLNYAAYPPGSRSQQNYQNNYNTFNQGNGNNTQQFNHGNAAQQQTTSFNQGNGNNTQQFNQGNNAPPPSTASKQPAAGNQTPSSQTNPPGGVNFGATLNKGQNTPQSSPGTFSRTVSDALVELLKSIDPSLDLKAGVKIMDLQATLTAVNRRR